ncbi:hypothetical protein BC828DRAFT_396073 [Blastocladiella britannica]|nr:hypothetical protein BC828DRAFT_396073 [Blastocladiella britannica]
MGLDPSAMILSLFRPNQLIEPLSMAAIPTVLPALLRPHFESYKLSPTPLPIRAASLPPAAPSPLSLQALDRAATAAHPSRAHPGYALTAARALGTASSTLVHVGHGSLAYLDSSWRLVFVDDRDGTEWASVPLPPPASSTITRDSLAPSLVVVRHGARVDAADALAEAGVGDAAAVVVGYGAGGVHVVRVSDAIGSPPAPVLVHSADLGMPLCLMVAATLVDTTEMDMDGGEATSWTATIAAYSYHIDAPTADPSSGPTLPERSQIGWSRHTAPGARPTTVFEGRTLRVVLDGTVSTADRIRLVSPAPEWESATHPTYARVTVDADTGDVTTVVGCHAEIRAPQASSSTKSDDAMDVDDNDNEEPMPSISTVQQVRGGRASWAWQQTTTDLTITVRLAAAISPRAVKCVIRAATLALSVTGLDSAGAAATAVFPSGIAMLWADVVPDESVWTLEDAGTVLVVHLEKRDHGTRWPQLRANAATPLETVDDADLREMRARLEKYHDQPGDTDQVATAVPRPQAPGIAVGGALADVEDVDVAAESVSLSVAEVRHAGRSVRAATCASLAVQCALWPAGVACKYDVDAVLLTPSATYVDDASSSPLLIHTGTAPALAYVLASKRDRRAAVATHQWAAVVDTRGTLAVYGYGAPDSTSLPTTAEEDQEMIQQRFAPQWLVGVPPSLTCGGAVEHGDDPEVAGMCVVPANDGSGRARGVAVAAAAGIWFVDIPSS